MLKYLYYKDIYQSINYLIDGKDKIGQNVIYTNHPINLNLISKIEEIEMIYIFKKLNKMLIKLLNLFMYVYL